MESLAVLGAAMLFIGFILVVGGIALYVMQAFGLYKMATNQGIENAWLAFIPYANYFIMGKVIKDLKILSYDIPSPELVLPIACFVLPILGRIPYIGILFWIAFAVLLYCSLYRLYFMYKGADAKVMTVLSIIFPFMVPIYIFTLRNAYPIQAVNSSQATF